MIMHRTEGLINLWESDLIEIIITLDMFQILLIEAFLFLLIASIQDIQTREVYDYISYSFIVIALTTRLIWFFIEWDLNILLYVLPSFAVMFGFSMVMYVAGQWGGGDAKLMAGLSIAFGTADLYFIDFLMNMLVFGAIYGVVYTLGLGLKNYRGIVKSVSVSFSVVSIISVIIALYLSMILPFGKIIAFMILLLLSVRYLQVIEKDCMFKDIPVEKLVEGDWLAQDIKGIEKKGIGLTKDQIKKIKSMKLKKVRVKEGIPFVPAFLVTLIGTYFLGNALLGIADYQYLGGLLSIL
jgi:Flp pilus assembly protein protease CpaA